MAIAARIIEIAQTIMSSSRLNPPVTLEALPERRALRSTEACKSVLTMVPLMPQGTAFHRPHYRKNKQWQAMAVDNESYVTAGVTLADLEQFARQVNLKIKGISWTGPAI